MTDLLQQAASWLDGMRRTHLSRLVTYERGGDSVEIAATLAATTYEVADEAGAVMQAKATDFIVSAEALVLGGAVSRPIVGDRVRVTVGDGVRVFEVLDLGGTGHFRACDPDGRMLRIHTKLIDEVTA